MKKLLPEEFPLGWREIPEPPKELWLEGEWPGSEQIFLTVVGSRKVSSYGREACEEILSGLAGQPIVIVSGLAIGIDTIAHKTALKIGLKTIGIPGSGLDRSVLHPPSNVRLADEIIAAGGALVSELAPTAPAGIHTFPRRNRLMAGLARGVLVIEAGDKSGTLITARLATEYNRDVYAVPGSIFSPGAAGTNSLIRQGATPITKSAELLEALGLTVEEKDEVIKFSELTADEKKVYELLAVEPRARDELIIELGFDASTAATILMMMELKGVIKESVGEFRLV